MNRELWMERITAEYPLTTTTFTHNKVDRKITKSVTQGKPLVIHFTAIKKEGLDCSVMIESISSVGGYDIGVYLNTDQFMDAFTKIEEFASRVGEEAWVDALMAGAYAHGDEINTYNMSPQEVDVYSEKLLKPTI